MRRPLCIGLLLLLSCYLTALWGVSKGGESSGPAKAEIESVLALEKSGLGPSADTGWEAWAGKAVLLSGRAAELYEPVDGSQGNKSFTLKQVSIYLDSGEEFSGISSGNNSFVQSISRKKSSVLCYLEDEETLPCVGSMVRVRGILTPFEEATNPGEFDMAGYYENRGCLFSVRKAVVEWRGESCDRIGNFLYELRCLSASVFVALLGEQDGAVASAMVLGIKKGMDQELKELYQNAGISHLLAISGLHVTLLGTALWKLLKGMRLPKWAAAFPAAVFVFFYGRIAGMSVSTLRAVILFFLTLAARLLGRTADPLTGLAVAACVILVPGPQYLQDSAFQLSFTAVAGAVTVVPVLQERGLGHGRERCGGREKIPDFLFRGVTSSMGITLATLPVLLFHYYKWNPWSIIANLAVIPLMGVLLPWLLLLAGSGMLLRGIPEAMLILRLLALPAKGIFFLYRIICRAVLWLPGSSLHAGKPEGWQVLFYCVGFAALLLWGRRIRPSVRLPLAGLLTAVFLIRLPGQLEITMLDVGQGECVCLETEEHHFYLIDAGSSSRRSAGQYQIIPFLEYSGVRRLEGIFITHWDEDHVNALEDVLEWSRRDHVAVGRLFLPETELADGELQKILDLAEQYGLWVERLRAGKYMKDGKMTLTCLHPYQGEQVTDRNASSCVLKLSSGNFRAIFTGDLEEDKEEWLVDSYGAEGLKADVLDAGHHGSANATGEEFLAAVSPRAVLISCGRNNSYGHPAKETLGRIEEQKAACFVTAGCGAVTVRVEKDGFLITAFLERDSSL